MENKKKKRDKTENKYKKKPAAEPETEAKTEAEILEEIREAMSKTPVKDFVMQFLMTLSSLAYQRLGIYQDPGKASVDLNQARLAIDCYGALVESLKSSLTEEEDKTLNNVLSSLRLAYIEKGK